MTDPTSTIHDLGYRRYEGPREGARGAFDALVWQGIRTMFGIGRPIKAKAVPVFVIVVTMLPALAALTASSASGGQMAVQYGILIAPQLLLFVLYGAAQAPEMLSRDQQHRVLPLMFTRDVTRVQYASARLLAMFSAMFVVCLGPLLLLYIGEIGIAKEPAQAFQQMRGKIGPVFLHATMTAWVIAGVSAALASLTARRAYATAAVIGVFLVVAAVATGLNELAGLPDGLTALLDPIQALRTMALMLFGETTRSMELNPPPPLPVFLVVLIALGAAGAAALLWRVRRVDV
jgi:ABC-2 type transport system permease protein